MRLLFVLLRRGGCKGGMVPARLFSGSTSGSHGRRGISRMPMKGGQRTQFDDTPKSSTVGTNNLTPIITGSAIRPIHRVLPGESEAKRRNGGRSRKTQISLDADDWHIVESFAIAQGMSVARTLSRLVEIALVAVRRA